MSFCQKLRCQSDTFLFRFQEKNRIGFFDNQGNIVIKPKFWSAGQYSDGLIAARINGLYGYVDRTGEYVIPPQFDYATDFKEGIAIIYQNNIPSYINKKGQLAFQTNYAQLGFFESGRALVKTKSKKNGLIDKSGKLIIDTIFYSIENMGSGLYIVITPDDEQPKNQTGIIDSMGNFIVPLGVYATIDHIHEGFASVDTYPLPEDSTGETSKSGFIDKNGNLLFLRGTSKKDGWLLDDFREEVAVITLYKYWIPEEEGTIMTSEKEYKGYINRNGEVLLNDTLIEDATDFSNGRAFIKIQDEGYYLIDKHFKKVSNQKFASVNSGFEKGYAFVSVIGKRGYGLIDRNGTFVFEPQFMDIIDHSIMDNHFFFGKLSPTEEKPYRYIYGIADVSGKILMEPRFEFVNGIKFQNGLLQVMIDQKLSYLDAKGNIIKQLEDDVFVEDLNIDYMRRGYFNAYSKQHYQEYGGYGRSYNEPKNIDKSLNFPNNQVSVLIKTDQNVLVDNHWNGYKLYVANTTKKNIDFNAQDSRLYLKIQAQDSSGQWKDIEYLPDSWCGNSYHILTLEKNEYWEFSVPRYQGDFKTKARAALTYNDPKSKNKDRSEIKTITIYSNAFEVSINNSQFWRKQSYYPSGIMDPYDD